MSADAPMLFVPPQPPFRLEAGREAVIGRSAECELRVPSVAASRRHAAVVRRGDDVLVRDLGSTNGTLVNGARIVGERALEAGDRIEVGGVIVTFCRVDASFAGVDSAPADRTVISFGPVSAPAASALRGDLAKIPMFAVLQMLEMGGQSGCLMVEGHDGECALWLANGRLVHAEAAKLRGLDAALEIAQTSAGRFEFAPGSPAPESSFEASMTEVILEASRLLDEASAG
jgi:pSer/pThr/pTyr-binding forkhead associated (FHA) protein